MVIIHVETIYMICLMSIFNYIVLNQIVKLERIKPMTEQEEKELRKSLNQKSKSEIISLFIKLRKIFDKSQERLYRVEQELIDKTNLEDLLENIVDK